MRWLGLSLKFESEVISSEAIGWVERDELGERGRSLGQAMVSASGSA